MSAKHHSRKGRPRGEGKRYPCGKLAPAGPTPEMIERRSEIVGKRFALNARAGWKLGQFRLRGDITESQYQAGLAYQKTLRLWRFVQDGLPGSVSGRSCGNQPSDEMTPREIEIALYGLIWADNVLIACFDFQMVRNAIRYVCCDPGVAEWADIPDRAMAAMRRGLDALGDHYRRLEDPVHIDHLIAETKAEREAARKAGEMQCSKKNDAI